MSNIGEMSDGYHTFNELYEHRHTLWIALCAGRSAPWRSRKHSDGSSFEGWFILGMGKSPGQQMTYHLPIRLWDACEFAEDLDEAPPFDGHTSNDVIERIKARFW